MIKNGLEYYTFLKVLLFIATALRLVLCVEFLTYAMSSKYKRQVEDKPFILSNIIPLSTGSAAKFGFDNKMPNWASVLFVNVGILSVVTQF